MPLKSQVLLGAFVCLSVTVLKGSLLQRNASKITRKKDVVGQIVYLAEELPLIIDNIAFWGIG